MILSSASVRVVDGLGGTAFAPTSLDDAAVKR